MTAESLLPLLVPIAVAIAGYGALRAKVSSLQADVDRKADQSTVDIQYASILRELQSISARLDRMESRP